MKEQKQSIEIIASLVMNGDISKLSAQQRVHYYKQFCEKLGLDPLLQPFRILRLHGREILYCDRGGAQQLNKLHKLSHEIKARENVNNCYVVTAQASTPDGRKTESIGAVPVSNLSGENLCNAMMKAETKAKRRATLDLLGLGILDETEVETMVASTTHEPTVDRAPETGDGIPDSLFLTDRGLRKAVNNCSSETELVALYNDNKSRIEKTPVLKKLFTERKNFLRQNLFEQKQAA
jgi:hypothetical protein